MELYYYCSYTGSPCGFNLGKLAFDGVPTAQTLSGGPFDPLINSCFAHGIVKKAYGLLPAAPGRRFLLIKDLNFRDADNTKFNMNIALVTENVHEYERWMKKGPSKETVAALCRRTMVVDRASKYGFTVDGAGLTKLIDCSFGSLFTPVASSATGEGPFFELSSASADLREAALDLGLSDGTKELTRVPDGGSWAELVKKKKSRSCKKQLLPPRVKRCLLKLLKIVAALFVLLLVFLILRIWKKAKS